MTEALNILEIAKQEPVESPTTTEKSANNIKERLNLHVKRRLQQEASPSSSGQEAKIKNNESESFQKVSGNDNNKQPIKTRKPYQKRTEKIVANAVRKYKRTKQKPNGGTAVGNNTVDVVGNRVPSECGTALNSTAVAAGEEDDGSHDGAQDTETKCGAGAREKEKCPDVLGMVLSTKKRALMQHPEVLEFLRKVMEAIKS